MKTATWATASLLALLTALVLASQGSGAQARFKGGDAGHFDVAAKACGPGGTWARVDIRGSGRSTRIGRYTYSALECFDGKLNYTGVFWITTGKSDMLIGSYRGTIAATTDPNVASYHQHAVIARGTGHFAGITGGFDVDGRANLKTGAYTQKLSGIGPS